MERDGETPGLRIDATVVKHGGQEMKAWCRVDELVEIYDPTTARCFVPGLGLQEVVMGGRSGPSVEGYSLVPAGS